jgi:hypothetical protein|tara:strand:+ start:296 stop:475 length:180 start_codon:yes stop_codon:yes gene_type:complete
MSGIVENKKAPQDKTRTWDELKEMIAADPALIRAFGDPSSPRWARWRNKCEKIELSLTK